MKNTGYINARNLMMSLMILAGLTASCEKEVVTQEHEGRVIVRELPSDRGGDDEEDPIVQGEVEDGNGNAVSNADVKIFAVGDTIPTAGETSDSNGEFTMQVPEGDYFFKVTHNGNTTTTNNFNITGDISVTIVI